MASSHSSASNIGASTSQSSFPPAANRPQLLSSASQTGDIALWLTNKLGTTTNDLWSDNSSIISQLNKEILRQIKDCFSELQNNVKLKLLLTFLHISRRNLEEWSGELEKILESAMDDNDPWVSVIGEMLRNYPRHGTINFDFQSNTSTFLDLVNEIKKIVKKHGDRGILPLECLYVNRPVFQSCYGSLPQPEKHFTLRRKAKSAALRAELLQKANDASAGKRSGTGPTVPIRCRGLTTDSTPLKGIPSRNSFGTSSGYNSYNSGYTKPGLSRLSSLGSTSTPSGSLNRLSRIASLGSGSNSMNTKRDGGIVLLDITEAPSTVRDPKRRKTTTLASDDKKAANPDAPESTTPSIGITATPASSAASSSAITNTTTPPALVLGHKSGVSETESPTASKSMPQEDPYDITRELAQTDASRPNMTGVTASKSTPDYAAGLVGSTNSPHPANRYGTIHDSSGPLKSSGISLLSNAGPNTSQHSTSIASNGSNSFSSGQNVAEQSTPTSPINTMYGVIRPQQTLMQSQPSVQQQQQHQQRLMYNPANSSILSQQVQARPAGQQSVIHPNPQQQQQQLNQQQMQFDMSMQQQQGQPRMFGMYGQMNPGQATKMQAGQLQQQQPQAAVNPPPPNPQRNLTNLNREITQQATAIFNASNCLTRPEKALIIGFMAGTQVNPAPHMGPVCMIRYLEKLEERRTSSGSTVTVVVEEHFQMNFSTNEWHTVQSVRQADSSYQVPSQDHSGNQTRIVVLDPTQQHHFITLSSGRAQPKPPPMATLAMQHGQPLMQPGQQGVRPAGVAAGSQFMHA
ncbi:hypothetical protein TYRP_012527 [Tyrophagus putrescentiae]|nr:hypothetical protein TYRP_012527 [Tyrophagus putrescentiae]